jgi:ATP-dependent Lon protease
MVIPLFVGRAKSIRALESAMDEGKQVLLVAQRSASKDEPEADDLYSVGTIASVLQMLKLPDGTVKVLVEGVSVRRSAGSKRMVVALSAPSRRWQLMAKIRPNPRPCAVPCWRSLNSTSNSTRKFRLKS